MYMVKPGAPAGFKRTVKNARGKPIKRLEFAINEPVEITDRAELKAIAGDIGHALVEMAKDGRGRLRVKKLVVPQTIDVVVEEVSEQPAEVPAEA
jgi:hypothetical protein